MRRPRAKALHVSQKPQLALHVAPTASAALLAELRNHAAAAALPKCRRGLALALLTRKRPMPPPPPPTMKAVVVRNAKCELELEWPTPTPAKGEVLIKVFATAINRLDTMQRAGKSPVPPGVTEVLGLEAAGVVVALGEGVDSLSLGDEVLALVSGGGYAEYVSAAAETTMRKPPHLTFEQAASIPEAWLTAWKLVHTIGKVQAGETVLIHAAASGVGLAAIQLVAAAGAQPLATVGSADKLALCQSVGAAGGAVRHDNGGRWADTIKELAPKGADVVLDPVLSSYVEQNLEVLGLDSRWVVYSMMSGAALAPELAPSFLVSLFKKRVALLPTTLRTRPLAFKQALVRGFAAAALPNIGREGAGAMRHVVDTTYKGLDQAQRAHEHMESNTNAGKIVLVLAD